MINNSDIQKTLSLSGSGMLIRKILILYVIYIFLPARPTFADGNKLSGTDSLLSCFFSELYDFSFSGADSIAELIRISDIDQATFSNIMADLAWWKLLSGDDVEANLKMCNDNIEASIKANPVNQHADMNSLYNIVYSYSLKARLANHSGNTLKAFINFYKSSAFVEKCIDSPEHDEKLNLILGLYYYFIDYIESKSFILNALFFAIPKGDKEKGLNYLENCSGSGDDMVRTEADYFLMKIFANTEKDYSKALAYAQILVGEHPKNLIYCMEQLRLLLIMKREKEAEEYKRVLIEGIKTAKNINNVQKNHFLSQISIND